MPISCILTTEQSCAVYANEPCRIYFTQAYARNAPCQAAYANVPCRIIIHSKAYARPNDLRQRAIRIDVLSEAMLAASLCFSQAYANTPCLYVLIAIIATVLVYEYLANYMHCTQKRRAILLGDVTLNTVSDNERINDTTRLTTSQ